jgi:hypothetical protein
VSAQSEAAGIVSGIDDTSFTINSRRTFLLGASYYGALGAPDDFIARDFDDLKMLGFNWIRVWAVWDAFDNNLSAVDTAGNAREPYLAKLKAVVTMTATPSNGSSSSVPHHVCRSSGLDIARTSCY